MDNHKERIRRLVSAASKLIILYEKELTAYHLAIRAAKRLESNKFDFDAALRKVFSAPGLEAEAEAEYAELEPLLHPISDTELPAALDRAASALERRLTTYTK
jgi:hypothetical protein